MQQALSLTGLLYSNHFYLGNSFSVTHNAERTRGNCIAVDVAAAAGRKCRDLLAESPNKGHAKYQAMPHVQI